MEKSRNNINTSSYSSLELETSTTEKTECSAVDDPDMECGIGGCRPKALHKFATIPIFIGVYSLSGLSTSVLAMFITSQITTLERHFGLSSSQSGFLMSCNDIGFLATTLFASYSARKVHIPRALCISSAIYGMGGLVCVMAYVFDPYKMNRLTQTTTQTGNSSVETRHAPVCRHGEVSVVPYNESSSVFATNLSSCQGGQPISLRPGVSTDYTFWAVTFIAVGMVLQGVAKSPRFPYIATFVDDNVQKTKTAMYIGK